jgi:hypothetical protein
LDYIKLRLFRILRKIIKVNNKLDLLAKIKIYLVQYIAILKPVYRNYKLFLYKVDTYKKQEKDK